MLIDLRFRIVMSFPTQSEGYLVITGLFAVTCSLLLWLTKGTGSKSIWSRTVIATLGNFRLRWPNLSRQKAMVLGLALASITLGIWVRYEFYARIPINPKIADMLPLIHEASHSLVLGEWPYKYYYVPWRLPLTFMPGLWLPYLPTYVLGLDLRHTGLLIIFLIGMIYLYFILQAYLGKPSRTVAFLATPIASLAGLVILMFSTEIVFFSAIGHTFPLWLWLSAFCFSILTDRYILAAIFFGMVLGSRQTSVVFAPAVCAFLYKTVRRSTQTAFLFVVAFVWLVLCAPFLLSTPKEFLIDPIVHYQESALLDFALGSNSYVSQTIGFSYILQYLFSTKTLLVFRYLSLVAIVFLSWHFTKDKTTLFISMALSGILFSFFTPIPWHYIYFGPLIILSFAMIAAARQADTCGQFQGGG